MAQLKKSAGLLSFLIMVIGLINFFVLAPDVDFIGNHIFPITFSLFVLSLILAICAEKGLWRKIAFGTLIAVIFTFIIFYSLMVIFWSGP